MTAHSLLSQLEKAPFIIKQGVEFISRLNTTENQAAKQTR